MMDGCTFCASKSKLSFNAIIKLERARTFLIELNSPERRKSYTP